MGHAGRELMPVFTRGYSPDDDARLAITWHMVWHNAPNLTNEKAGDDLNEL